MPAAPFFYTTDHSASPFSSLHVQTALLSAALLALTLSPRQPCISQWGTIIVFDRLVLALSVRMLWMSFAARNNNNNRRGLVKLGGGGLRHRDYRFTPRQHLDVPQANGSFCRASLRSGECWLVQLCRVLVRAAHKPSKALDLYSHLVAPLSSATSCVSLVVSIDTDVWFTNIHSRTRPRRGERR